jgi:type IV pilus assembly protein PilA
MLRKIRERMESEKGFTLIELLVVILIIGILAAIALPAFLGQREKGQDAQAKSAVRNAASAAEAYYTDNQQYTGMDEGALIAIEPSLSDTPGAFTVDAAGDDNYALTVASSNDHTFTITKTGGTTTRTCDPPDSGGCSGGNW